MECRLLIPAMLLLGCAVLVRCQNPPADDEDFVFAREGSGRAAPAPSGRAEPLPAQPARGAGVWGSVARRDPVPGQPDYAGLGRDDYGAGDDYGADGDYGSGDGSDDDYVYEDEYDYYDDYEDYDEDEDAAEPSDPYVPAETVPAAPQPEAPVGVVLSAPPPRPEHGSDPLDRLDTHGRQNVYPPPVYGTETRPSQEPPHEDDVTVGVPEEEIQHGVVVGPASPPGPRDDVSDEGAGDTRPDDQLPDGMGSKAPVERNTSFFAQPGILAAVVGGAVVGLLCAILLVMLIVYRMRKKDEGSYALDEPKRSLTGNSYSKNYNKEFYA